MTASAIAADYGVRIGASVIIKVGRLGAGTRFTVTTITGIGAQALRGPCDVSIGDSRQTVRLLDAERIGG